MVIGLPVTTFLFTFQLLCERFRVTKIIGDIENFLSLFCRVSGLIRVSKFPRERDFVSTPLSQTDVNK